LPDRRPRHFSLVLEYDGAPFHGWQRQPGQVPTVQGTVEEALGRILGSEVRVRGAGRTDAGVHALRQWATFSAPSRPGATELRRALNAVLPPAVRVRRLDESRRALDALRESVRKTYFYQWHVGDYLPAHRRATFGHAGRRLDLPAMRAGAAILTGRHDFSSFATEAHRQRSCVRELSRTRIVSLPGGVRMFFTAPGFLYNMVRALAAALVEVGTGRWSVATLGEVLAASDRSRGPATAPPQGLFLLRVEWAESVTRSLRRDAEPERVRRLIHS
jgi:tRNA pseudouridine38-40 synthase